MRVHGGDRAARLDFSSNINPLGPPQILYKALTKCIEDRAVLSYPDYDYQDLRRIIANFYRCDQEHVVPTNGAAEALNLVIMALRPRSLVVVEPSYGEYEDLAKVLGIKYIDVYYLRDEKAFYIDLKRLRSVCKKVDLIVITNPNNPTGSYAPIEDVVSELSNCRSTVVVDEAYAELCTRCPIDVASEAPRNFIFVRSLTKWLAVPGLRIGFIFTSNDRIIDRVNALRQPWNVNGIAECTSIQILQQEGLRTFIEDTRRYIELEGLRVSRALRDMGLQTFDSVTNFLLVDVKRDASEIVANLRKRGIAVRSCRSFRGLGPNYIRISIRKRNENDELIKALSEELGLG